MRYSNLDHLLINRVIRHTSKIKFHRKLVSNTLHNIQNKTSSCQATNLKTLINEKKKRKTVLLNMKMILTDLNY
jgi:hypothetical protein